MLEALAAQAESHVKPPGCAECKMELTQLNRSALPGWCKLCFRARVFLALMLACCFVWLVLMLWENMRLSSSKVCQQDPVWQSRGLLGMQRYTQRREQSTCPWHLFFLLAVSRRRLGRPDAASKKGSSAAKRRSAGVSPCQRSPSQLRCCRRRFV